MNSNDSTLSRRKFLFRLALGAVVVSSQWLLTACGGSSSNSGGGGGAVSGGNCSANGTGLETTGITDDHSHTIQLTAAQINAADTSAVFTTSSAGHTHPVQLTAQQFASLQGNQGVSLSTEDGGAGHTHTLVFNCA
jgi:hypothetical protein